MLVSNDVDGGEIVAAGEETRFFDDIGCLAAGWKARHENATAFVRVDGTWSDAGAAWFAESQSVRTPMASGLRAYATADAARANDRAGRALTWDDVLGRTGGTR